MRVDNSRSRPNEISVVVMVACQFLFVIKVMFCHFVSEFLRLRLHSLLFYL